MNVYHGTRAPLFDISQGLRYPGEDQMLALIERGMQEVGLSYTDWIFHQEKFVRERRLCILNKMRRPTRKVIWTTTNLETAWSYARRSPELVSEAVREEYLRLHWRRKNAGREASDLSLKAVEWVGDPKVVVLDALKIGARGGHNEPTLAEIPSSAIVGILLDMPPARTGASIPV